MDSQVYITVDRGNTLTKIAVWQNDQLKSYECFEHDDFASMARMASASGASAAMVCSVAAPADDIVAALSPYIPHVEVLRHDTPMPLKVKYNSPLTLGVDRLAAAVGASSLAGENVPVLVVDAGTAVTYDCVTARGEYLGGNIAPGIRMRFRSLNSFTARLPLVDVKGPVPFFGSDTKEAIRVGAVRGVVAELIYYKSLMPIEAKVVIGGGDAPVIIPHLPFNAIYEPHLVTLGLKQILNYNEETHPHHIGAHSSVHFG